MRRFPRYLTLFSLISLTLFALVLAFSTTSAVAQDEPAGQDTPVMAGERGRQVAEAAQSLRQDSGGEVAISFNDATGVASFVRVTEPGALAPDQAGNGNSVSNEAKAAAFFVKYGGVFGIDNPRSNLTLTNSARNNLGLDRLTYHQVYNGVGVFAGVLKVSFDRDNQISAVNGIFIPDLNLSVIPNLSPVAAADKAIATVQLQNGLQAVSTDLAAVNSRLVIFRSGLVQGNPGANHLAYEVEVANRAISIREFVFVDAHTGKIIDQITGIFHGLDREISEQTLGNVVWSEGNSFPTGNTDWDNEIDGAGESYNVFASMTGGAYLSYDGADAKMRTVNNDPTINCPNANWNGTSTNYCTGVTGDDTVAHEWGHAYTEKTNNLIYQWQSGALNESYSDIWGEVVDMLNGRGTDAPLGLRTAGSCSTFGNGAPKNDSSYRWLSGEDDPAFGGAIRDLWNPTCYGDPGKVTDSQYVCSTADSGGVHSNSGVPNHAFALMVDGGSYNGQSVSGIGLIKAAHIHWEAQNLLGPASNFVDHADALETACSDLTGINLPALSTTSINAGLSGQVITAADCTEVADAIAAVQFRTEPTQCNFQPMLDPNAPALCSAGETVTTIDNYDFESDLNGWTTGTRAVASPSTFDTPDWATIGSLPSGAPAGSFQAAFVADLIIGDCAADDESGVLYMDSPVMNVPAGANLNLAFDHWVATELGWDGGNLKISVNGGGWQLVPSSAFTFNPYSGNLSSAIAGNTNPLAGQAAFTGTDGGAAGGSWGQSQVDLSGLASGGNDVQLRYEFGVDGCNGIVGWYVDNVHTYSCEVPVGEMHVSNIEVVKASQGPNRLARALVTIVDQNANPLASVTVDGTFTGPTSSTSGPDSQSTGVDGVATLSSPKAKRVTGDWTFCVNDVSFGSWTYNAAANVETCDGTAAPPALGTVIGTVTEVGGSAIEGATVSADTGQSATTKSDGTYTMNNVPAGSRTINVSATGYTSLQKPATVTDGGTSTVNFELEVQASAVMHVGDLDGSSAPAARKRWSATVTITVHDASDAAVAGAIVNGTWSNGATGGGSCSQPTDINGQCTITKNNLKANASSATFTVANITRDTGDSYDSIANHDPDGEPGNGDWVVISKP